jgi:hypothetical protein
MTDEERKQFIEFLRYYRESSEYGKTWADKAADEIERLAAALAQSDAEPVQAFAKAVLHGDDEHKAWLLEAAGAFIAGNPLPAPRGKGAAPPPKPKPVYCLGWNTINYVREHGTLETENVAFIAASDLLHDPRPDASAGLIEAAELAEKYVNGMDRLRADTITGKSLKEFANILRARAADRSGK